MSRNQGRTFAIIIALLAAATLAVYVVLRWQSPQEADGADGRGDRTLVDRSERQTVTERGDHGEVARPDRGSEDTGAQDDRETEQLDVRPPETVESERQRAALPSGSDADARAAYRRGLELLSGGDMLAARAALSRAILSGGLSAADETDAIARAASLAERTLLSSEIFPGDGYASYYTVQSGDTLADQPRRKGVISKLDLRIPPEAVLRINGVRDARNIRAGQDLKVVKGPFHAIVTKHRFTCDLYLHREGLEPVFVRRTRVGLGKNGSTPCGLWRVSTKQPYATWYPPPNAPHRRPIRPGEPDYPFGEKGLWIGLDGVDQNTEGRFGYGLHGTNDPSTIGQEASLGCIRLADEDIELAFDLLREGHSTVEVRP